MSREQRLALVWQDTTSYSRDEKPPRIPRVWGARAGRFRLTVLKSHRDWPGHWVMHVHPGVLDTHDMQIPDGTPEDAQLMAEDVFLTILDEARSCMKGHP